MLSGVMKSAAAEGPGRLYVGSLHPNITDDMLKGIFEPFGKVSTSNGGLSVIIKLFVNKVIINYKYEMIIHCDQLKIQLMFPLLASRVETR